MTAPPVGAYGLRVSGLEGAGPWLGPVPERFPQLRIVFGMGPRPPSVTDDRVVFELEGDRSLEVGRLDGSVATATFWDAQPPTIAECVHPLLTAAAAVAGAWGGYDSFHAAGIVGTGGVWGILGQKASGKSTLAAAMAGRGHPVVCDDMLALRGTTAFAGPRCVDLRPDAALHLALGEDLGSAGSRPRWRVTLPPLGAELPMAGWVFLAWGGSPELTAVAPREVLVRLAGHQTWPRTPIGAEALLDLAALPAWELRRPRAWSSLGSVVDALEAAIG